MICDLSHIEQPYSGEYEEKIYDINSSWNSGDWSWILFEKEDGHCFCGEFRGKYMGAVLSEKLAVIIVLTSDYLFILDLGTAKLLDYKQQPSYIEITRTPLGDILLNDESNLNILKNQTVAGIDSIPLPIHPDFLKFEKYDGASLLMSCEESGDWEREITLILDCNSLTVKKL